MTKFYIYRVAAGCWRLAVPDTADVPHWWWPYSDYASFADAVVAFDRALAQTMAGPALRAMMEALHDAAANVIRCAPRLLPVDRLFTEGR